MIRDHLYFQGVPTTARRTVPGRNRAHADQFPDSGNFFQWLFERGGLAYGAYRKSALERRIPACLRHLGVSDLIEARARLETEPHLIRSTVNVIMLGVTEFYRDQAVFDDLTKRLRENVPCGSSLRVWSAATSCGHELYTMAIILSELGFLETADLWGTDLRLDAIEQARTGRCSPESLGFLPQAWREKYFTMKGGYYQISPSLRARLMWIHSDLLLSVEPGPWDVILWRNMAIYLETTAARPIWIRLHRELAKGGLLVTGKAEAPPPDLEFRKLASCIYEKI